VFLLDAQGRQGAETSDPGLAREAIAWYQVAAHAFRNGWLGDEEQIAPAARVAPDPVAARLPR
jgi:hypothetical protein